MSPMPGADAKLRFHGYRELGNHKQDSGAWAG